MKLSEVPIEQIRVDDIIQGITGNFGYITKIEYIWDMKKDKGYWEDDHIIYVQFYGRKYLSIHEHWEYSQCEYLDPIYVKAIYQISDIVYVNDEYVLPCTYCGDDGPFAIHLHNKYHAPGCGYCHCQFKPWPGEMEKEERKKVVIESHLDEDELETVDYREMIDNGC